MTQRSHLFPFRTQKLSSVVPKILGWRRPGKIGRRRLSSSLYPFHSYRPVSMTQRSHLFPFRTQKLSSVVPKILGWRRPGKIGRRRLFFSLYFQHGPLVKRSRRRPLTPQTGVRFSHGSPRRNGLHSIQKAQPFGWAFLIPFRHSSFSPQNFARQIFAGAPIPKRLTCTPAEWTAFHSKTQPNSWAFFILISQTIEQYMI